MKGTDFTSLFSECPVMESGMITMEKFLTSLEYLLRRSNDFSVLINSRSKFFLQITDAICFVVRETTF